MSEATCIGCGCRDSHACMVKVTPRARAGTRKRRVQAVPCWWVKVDYSLGIGVCSECVEKLEEFEEKQLSCRPAIKLTS